MTAGTLVAMDELIDVLRPCKGFEKLEYTSENDVITAYFLGVDVDVSKVPKILNGVSVFLVIDEPFVDLGLHP